MNEWDQFDDGRSIGRRGSEDGIIIRDEEHPDGSRITLERGGYSPFSITCGIYGWMMHTRFFSDEAEAQKEFEVMKDELAGILNIIPSTDAADDEKVSAVSDAISSFVERFP